MKPFNPSSIKFLRESYGLSQHQFAQRLVGTYQAQHISAWETGKAVPRVDSLVRIANAFHVGFDFFFTEECLS